MSYTYKQIWRINFPVMMSLLMERLVNITDAIFLGRVGEVELGAAALAGVYYLAVYMLGFGFSLGLQVLIAHRNGERNYMDTGKVFFQGLYILLGLAAVVFVLARWLTPVILSRMITSDVVREAATSYLEWRFYGLFFAFPLLALRSFFVGIVQTRILTVNAITLILTNIGLNYLLVFGKGGLPALGIAGAAMASSLAEGLTLVILVIFIAAKTDKKRYGLKPVFDSGEMRRLWDLSVWSMLRAFISVVPWFFFFVFLERIGSRELAIANIIRSISTLFFVIVSSFATTAGSLTGNLIGAGKPGEVMPLCRRIIRLSYLLGIPLIALVWIFPDPVLGVYTPDAGLVRDAYAPLYVMLAVFIFSAPAYVWSNAVSGTGRTRLAFLFQVGTIVCYMGYLLLLKHLEVHSIAVYWSAEHFFVLLLFLCCWGYMQSKKWRRKGGHF